MTASRAVVIARIEHDLADRELVWFGTRGDDADGISDIANLTSAFSIIGRYTSRATVNGHALETLSGLRVDLDAHDIDEDPFVEPIRELRRELLAALAVPSVVFTYRPSTFLSAAAFARTRRTTYLGMFKDHQAAFEHKPWVETAVAGMDLPRIPWKYVADSEREAVLRMFRDGPVVLRLSRSSGGTGVARIDDPDQLVGAWPTQDEAFVSVAPFLGDTVPVNVGGVIWDHDVTVDYPSVQLIGVPGVTTRPFGYCGNDFTLAKDFSVAALDEIETATVHIGRWMHSHGYRGAFGVDFLMQGDTPLFMEVNPRFQGSTHASSRIGRILGDSCIMTDHLSSLLHHEPGTRRPLAERMRDCPDLAHLIVHNSGPRVVGVDAFALAARMSGTDGFVHADVLHPSALECEVGATVGRFTFSRSLTTTGFDLAPDVRERLSRADGDARVRVGT